VTQKGEKPRSFGGFCPKAYTLSGKRVETRLYRKDMTETARRPLLLPVPLPEALDRFLKYVESTGMELYPAQEEALLSLAEECHVILNTPTGSGKSLVALFLQFLSLSRGGRSVYTCPIKALVNEKFLQLCEIFGPDEVGLSTGDASVNQGARILVCTAEVLSEIALHGKESIDSVIMDEFHYYSDPERGVAWQVPLLILKNTQFLLMSATLGDMEFIAGDLKKRTGKEVNFISGTERPVPLEYQYSDRSILRKLESLIAENKAPVYVVHFSQRESVEFAEQLLSQDFCSSEEKKKLKEWTEGDLFTSPFGERLKRLLRHGVGLHHAGILPKYRILVEKLAQKGLLKIICGTDTLGVGINVPIRTVLFSGLNKFDGKRVGMLTIRDFQQVAGRAGRRGFDTTGWVVVQAPEHVVENLEIDQKIKNDPGKAKKLVKKKPPEKGYVPWDASTVEKLRTAKAEALQSRFKVTYGMVLHLLSRENGHRALKDIIRTSHESAHLKKKWRRTTFQMIRSLLQRGILKWDSTGIRPSVELPEEFSLHQTLSLFLLDLLKHVPFSGDPLELEILTVVESILENPDVILRKQLDAVKRVRVNELKAEGMDYDDRMIELEKCEYPKPLKEKLYQAYDEFSLLHPWMEFGSVKPKSIVREMIEQYSSFSDYIKEYELERSEGVLLRYLMEVYKVMNQTLPDAVKTEEVELIIEYLKFQIRSTDSSLLEEWNRLKGGETALNPAGASQLPAKFAAEKLKKNRTVALRNAVGVLLRAISQKQWARASFATTGALGSSAIESAWTPYFSEFFQLKTDSEARNPKWLTHQWTNDQEVTFSQICFNRDGETGWIISGKIEFLPESNEISRMSEVKFEH
jgi:superfamily II RNA helicase